jgi:hypothetical protein
MTTPLAYTASQIARAAGISRQAVYAGLERVTPAGQVAVESKAADAWVFSALPLDWQMAIARRAVRRGFENGELFLASLPLAPWSPPLPWDRVPGKEQGKAARLQKALARALELRSGGTAAGDVEKAGIEDFRSNFGYKISGRHWRRLLQRTIERDGGEENWQRLEIYLDERTFNAAEPKREAVRNEYKHHDRDDVIATLENRLNPTPLDRQFLWHATFRHFEQRTETLPTRAERSIFKRSLLSYLFKAFPGQALCAGLTTLKRRFNEKLIQWRNGGRIPEALEDRRALDSGNFHKQDFSADLKKIRDLAIQLDGGESLAHQMLRERGELSPEFCQRYQYSPRQNKSALADSIRDAITPEVDMCLPLRRGPWQARMRGPYIPRDWSDVKPGDWFNADDVTWNHYFKERNAAGRWIVMRGECLLMTDLRTGYPLDFLLVPGKYNGEHVRRLALEVHDRVGLPRCGFYFERGVWKSRLVVGDNRHGTPVSWREAENGLCSSELKLTVRHATTPRAKPIEGLLHILQDRMRCIPGFVGFNERTEEFERVQALKARADRGDAEALAQFPTKTEWRDKIAAVLDEYRNAPQNGKMLEGSSPAEAWADEIRQRPLRRLPDEARYILSTHRKKTKVHKDGIIITIRGKHLVYYNEHTGKLIGQEVTAYYDLERPELLTVHDMKRNQFFSVRSVALPAMAASREQLAEVNRLRNAHMAHARGIFGELKHEVVSTITRDNEHSAESRELGRFHDEEADRFQAEQADSARTQRKARAQASALGASEQVLDRHPDRILKAAEMRRHAEQLRQQETIEID